MNRSRRIFFYAVHDGLAKIYKCTASGKHVVFKIAGPGDTLNAAALTEKSYFSSAQALSDITLLRIVRQTYHSILYNFPEIAMKLISVLAKRLDQECNMVLTLLSEQVEQRLEIILMNLYEKFGANIPITCQELANCIGTSTETTIRVLSRLKKTGYHQPVHRYTRAYCYRPGHASGACHNRQWWLDLIPGIFPG